MSVAKKRKPYQYPKHEDTQENLRQTKMEVEQLKEKLQRSILENPKLAEKSARLISLWIQGKKKKS